MSYSVKEIYYTLQGEGINAGRPAVFCRFAGCNLWTGLEADRASAVCQFCDTDFRGTDGPGGGRFEAASDLASAVLATWENSAELPSKPLVVLTGGEPLLQLDDVLVDALHDSGFEVAIETNGTLIAPRGVDWICVSPKAGAELVLKRGDELKLVYPQSDLNPCDVELLEFDHFLLQPMDGPDIDRNVKLAADYCLRHPKWRLCLQTHKLIGLP